MNWQYLVRQESGKISPINDFDSILIGSQMESVKVSRPRFRFNSKKFKIVSQNRSINLYSSLIVSKKGDMKVIFKATSNDREERERPDETNKRMETESESYIYKFSKRGRSSKLKNKNRKR
jgi:hypothetical protein